MTEIERISKHVAESCIGLAVPPHLVWGDCEVKVTLNFRDGLRVIFYIPAEADEELIEYCVAYSVADAVLHDEVDR